MLDDESVKNAYIESLGLSLDASVEYVIKRSLDFLGVDADAFEYQDENNKRKVGIRIKDSIKLRQELKSYHNSEGRFTKLKGNPLLSNAERDSYLLVLGKRIDALRGGAEYIRGDLRTTPSKQQQHLDTLLQAYKKYAGKDYDANP